MEKGICDYCGKVALVGETGQQDEQGAWLRCCSECYDGMSEPAA